MNETAKAALESLLALRKITFETNTQTRRSQNVVLQKLNDADMITVAAELARHQEQFGW